MSNSFAIVHAKTSDIKGIIEVEKSAWGEEAATAEMFEKRLELFHEGVLVAKDPSGTVVGVVVVCIRDYKEEMIFNGNHPAPNWFEVTGDGFIESVHNLDGNVVYGVDLSVHQNWGRSGVGKALVRAGMERVVVPFNKRYALVGGRMPGYVKCCSQMTAEQYVKATHSGGVPLDDELAFFTSIEYCDNYLKITRFIPEYFTDPASLNYGVLLCWENPFFKP